MELFDIVKGSFRETGLVSFKWTEEVRECILYIGKMKLKVDGETFLSTLLIYRDIRGCDWNILLRSREGENLIIVRDQPDEDIEKSLRRTIWRFKRQVMKQMGFMMALGRGVSRT